MQIYVNGCILSVSKGFVPLKEQRIISPYWKCPARTYETFIWGFLFYPLIGEEDVKLGRAMVRVKAFDFSVGNKIKANGDVLEIIDILPNGNLMTNKRIVNKEDIVELIEV